MSLLNEGTMVARGQYTLKLSSVSPALDSKFFGSKLDDGRIDPIKRSLLKHENHDSRNSLKNQVVLARNFEPINLKALSMSCHRDWCHAYLLKWMWSAFIYRSDTSGLTLIVYWRWNKICLHKSDINIAREGYEKVSSRVPLLIATRDSVSMLFSEDIIGYSTMTRSIFLVRPCAFIIAKHEIRWSR